MCTSPPPISGGVFSVREQQTPSKWSDSSYKLPPKICASAGEDLFLVL